MTDQTPAGPSGVAAWESRAIEAGPAPHRPALLLPDAANRPGGPQIYHAVLAEPQLARNAAGEPVFLLTLILARPPRPDEQNIAPLIQQGRLSFETVLGLSQVELEGLEKADPQSEYHPLFARQGSFRLQSGREGEEPMLAEAAASGSALRAALSATLTRTETLDVLAALDGVESALHLYGELSFRAVNPQLTVHLVGSWANAHDFLTARQPVSGEFSRAELRQHFYAMLAEGVLSTLEVPAAGQGRPFSAPFPDFLFDLFMRLASVLVERRSPEMHPEEEANRYGLRPRPHPMFTLDYQQKLSGDTQRRLAVQARLDALLGGALDGLERSRYIHLVALGSGSSGVAPAPRRLRTGRATSRGGSQAASLALVDGSARSVALALRPSARPLASQALIASDVVLASGFVSDSYSWWVDDLLLEPSTKPKIRSLPVVEDPNAVLWRDRLDPLLYWYPPAFEVLQPAANADPRTSPFLFIYQRTGATSSGRPALAGSVRCSLQKKMSPVASARLAAIPGARARPLPTRSLSVTLSVPFVDEADGRTKRHAFIASLTQEGETITVNIDLINDWVRLCYGALSVPGFQSAAVSLETIYSFEAYVPVQADDLQLVAGGKLAHLPVAYSAADGQVLGGQPHFDAVEAAYHHPLGEIRLKREAPQAAGSPAQGASTPPSVPAPRSRPAARAASGLVVHASKSRGEALAGVNLNLSPVVVSRPQLRPGEALAVLIQETQYASRSLVRQDNQALLFSCRTLGELYRETLQGGDQSIGCRDALQLGSTTYQQYEEILELADERCRVYRSLQQPGRFLALPAVYRITRYSPEVPDRAFQPVMIVYSVLDAENDANNRVVFQAGLQPDLPPFARRALLAALAQRSAHPVLEFPTSIPADVEYAWTLDRSLRVEPSAVRTPDSLQVSLATDLPGALLLRSILENTGVFGSVRFKLPDGTSLSATLHLDLRQLTGPWETGPLELDAHNGGLRLTNRIESQVEISDLLAYPESGPPRSLAVEASLPPGAARIVPLGGATGELYPVYSLPPGTPATLEEIRSVVEDVHTNVIFINLIHFSNHNLSRLDVQARLKDFGATYPIAMSGDPPRGAIDLILPLTVYLEKHILQFQVTKTFQGGAQEATPWLEWDLRQNGNIISLTWEMIR